MTTGRIDRDYLLRRRAQHLRQASTCTDEAHRALHLHFAELYRARADGELVVEEH